MTRELNVTPHELPIRINLVVNGQIRAYIVRHTKQDRLVMHKPDVESETITRKGGL